MMKERQPRENWCMCVLCTHTAGMAREWEGKCGHGKGKCGQREESYIMIEPACQCDRRHTRERQHPADDQLRNTDAATQSINCFQSPHLAYTHSPYQQIAAESEAGASINLLRLAIPVTCQQHRTILICSYLLRLYITSTLPKQTSHVNRLVFAWHYNECLTLFATTCHFKNCTVTIKLDRNSKC